MLIIHIEPQSSQQTHFHQRMYLYFSLLYNKYRKPIIPIAIFSYEENWEKNQYTMTFPFFHVLSFNYLTLHLKKQNWRTYIESTNPVAAALLSKMGYTEDEKVQVKKEFLRMIVKMELDPARQRLVYGFFERYLTLNDQEEEKLMEEIKQLDEAERILEIPISYEEKGIEEGIKKVALEMLRKGLDIDFIMELTKLKKHEIEELKRKI